MKRVLVGFALACLTWAAVPAASDGSLSVIRQPTTETSVIAGDSLCRGSRGKRRPGVTAAYRRMRARWHAPSPRGLMRAWLASEARPLELRPIHHPERYSLLPDAEGRFDEAQLASASEAFRYHEDGATTDVHPRLLEVLYRAVTHFEVPYVTLISGFRTTRGSSRHNQGRAMDVVLPGVTDRKLANFLRKQGYVGVGVYTQSGFVHLDVRAQSYFFVDGSAPGRRSRPRRVAAELARRQDVSARRRGELAVADIGRGGDDDEGEIIAVAAPDEPGPDTAQAAAVVPRP